MDELAARIGETSTITKNNITGSKTEGVSDPFEDMYRLVFKLTMRMVGCDEIAEDEDLLQRVLRIFEGIDGASTATKVMFPWMPTVGHLRRVYSGAQMYMILEKIIKERKDRGVPGSDALQYLMENGDSTVEMVAFIVGALFAGLINSGINAAYLLCFMATEKTWYTEVQKEVDGVIARHRLSEEETAEQILGRLDMETWEAEFPMIDLGLKETIRHTITGCGFRYNGSGKDVAIGGSGEVVPNDAYAVYHFDTTHMDPGFFPEPLRWDPGRYLPGREEDKKDPHAFIGWGAGRHPCLGMRVSLFFCFFGVLLLEMVCMAMFADTLKNSLQRWKWRSRRRSSSRGSTIIWWTPRGTRWGGCPRTLWIATSTPRPSQGRRCF